MSEFDIDRFEERIDTLMRAHQRVLADYRSLQQSCDAQRQRNTEIREQLNSVIERIRALEAEAENA